MSATDPASIVDRLHAADATARRLGIEVVEAAAGAVTLSMVVGADDTNALGMGHGGMLFTLADTALQLTSNSHGVDAVATSAEIDFVRPGAVGQRLTAVGRETVRTGKAAICDVEITNDAGETIAVFRGRTLQIGKRP